MANKSITEGMFKSFNYDESSDASDQYVVVYNSAAGNVKINGDSSTYKPAGITINTPLASQDVTVRLLNAGGTAFAVAATAISFGARVTGAANGKIATATDQDDYTIGYALEAATADGDEIEIELRPDRPMLSSGGFSLADGEFIKFGTGNDVTMNFDGTNFEVEGAAANTTVLWGADSYNLNTTIKGTVTVGKSDTGHDVKFFGATSAAYLLWDESADKLILEGSDINLNDGDFLQFGDSQDVTLNFDGTNFEIQGAATATTFLLGTATNKINTTVRGEITVGVSDTGHDVKFFGATSGSYFLWDESGDVLLLQASHLKFDGTASKLINAAGAASNFVLFDAVGDGGLTSSTVAVPATNFTHYIRTAKSSQGYAIPLIAL